jgi:uroporphyrinogen-III synthase
MSRAVVLTAAAGSFPGLVEAIRALPAAVEEHPLMSFAPPLDWRPVDEAIAGLSRFAAIAVTSPRAAGAFAARLALHPDPMPPVWASGPGTVAALGATVTIVRTPPEQLVGDRGAAAALATAMLEAGLGGPVLFPCGEIRHDELPARLRAEGVTVQEVICYRSVLASEAAARLAVERARVLVVASPSVADLLSRARPSGLRPLLLAVGPTTAAAAHASGWRPDGVAKRPTVEGLTAGVRGLLATR